MSHLQSLVFDRSLFSPTQAKDWALSHNFKPIKPPHATQNFVHIRLRAPSGKMRYIPIEKGIRAIAIVQKMV